MPVSARWMRLSGMVVVCAIVSGCAVTSLAVTAASVAVSAASTAASVAATTATTAARVTGKVVEAAVELALPSPDEPISALD